MTDILKIVDILPNEAKHLAQKLHRKKDDIDIYRKGYDAKIEGADEAERSLVARVSTADRDRDGEVVEPKGIDLTDYLKNNCLLWAHRYDQPPIGKALWSKVDEKGLVCKFQFAKTQFAEDIYQLYKGGFMNAFSIGFIPVDFDRETKTHKKISLLEVSAVPVPANQNALVMQEAYAKGIITSEALKHDLGIEDPAPESSVIVETPETVTLSGEDNTDLATTDTVPEEKVAEVVNKPETTDAFHRIPVSDGHDGHTIRTITVSAKDGIKALYCVDDKVIITYLFDVEKWSMDEAQAWVDEHKKAMALLEPDIALVAGFDGAIDLEFDESDEPMPDSLKDIHEGISSLMLQMNILIKRVEDLADRVENKTFTVEWPKTDPDPTPAPALAPEPAPAPAPEPTKSVLSVTAADEPEETRKLKEWIKSGELNEYIRIAIAKAKGKVI